MVEAPTAGMQAPTITTTSGEAITVTELAAAVQYAGTSGLASSGGVDLRSAPAKAGAETAAVPLAALAMLCAITMA